MRSLSVHKTAVADGFSQLVLSHSPELRGPFTLRISGLRPTPICPYLFCGVSMWSAETSGLVDSGDWVTKEFGPARYTPSFRFSCYVYWHDSVLQSRITNILCPLGACRS